jgi:hypothetical protein
MGKKGKVEIALLRNRLLLNTICTLVWFSKFVIH